MEKQPSSPRWWDTLSAALLLAALLTSATRLYATEWTGFLERVQYLTLLGGLAGLALGYSRFTPRLAKWIGFGYTLFVIPWQLGYTLSGNLPWSERLNILVWRVSSVLNLLVQKQPFSDSILFFTLMLVLFWTISLVAGYYLIRHGQPWPAIIPAGIALIVIDHFDPHLPSSPRYLLFFLFFVLIIVGRLTYLRYRAEWDSQGVMRAPGAGTDIGRAAFAAVVIVMMFAWVAPVAGQAFGPASQLWVKINKPWENVRSRFQDVFSSLQSSVGVVTDFYGSNLALGTGTHLGNDIVFTVTTNNPPPKGSSYYWQARTYDYYDGSWNSTINDAKSYGNLGITLTYPSWTGRDVADFTFTSKVTLLNTIYAPPLPMWVSRSGTAAIQSLPGDMEDLSFLAANPPIHAGDTYQVHAWISDPTQDMLRKADPNYPSWITSKYLELPRNLSPKFAELAKRITVGLSNNYDKTEAITAYLRRTIKYSETIDPTPAGQDPLEYFLFVSQKGYCNYYATAEVVLLRSIGIPARLAVGFAQGSESTNTGTINGAGPTQYTYTVRYKESHAWPEVYFTNAGWVEFEPTVSQNNRLLPAGNNDPTEPLNNNQDPALIGNLRGSGGFDNRAQDPIGSAFESVTHSQPAQLAFMTFTFLGIVLAIVIALRLRQRRVELPILPVWAEERLRQRGIKVPAWLHRWARRSLFSPLEKSYGVINQSLGMLGRPAKPSQTPTERVAALAVILPETQPPAEVILREYQNAQYSPYPGDIAQARHASGQVRQMTWKVYFRRMFARFNDRGRGY